MTPSILPVLGLVNRYWYVNVFLLAFVRKRPTIYRIHFQVRRTIGREVKKERLLGKGRFGEKWVVIRNEEFIVMKIFSTLEEEQYMREKKIYQTGICHANILG